MIEKSLYDIKIDQHRFQILLGPVEGSITAVIPTCGKSKLLDQCLDSLDDETKVILVANKAYFWDEGSSKKHKGYFAGVHVDGRPMCWRDGRTSWTAYNQFGFVVWDHAELAEDGE